MTTSNFARALDIVLQYEGGYVNHPADPGGPTNLGITMATLRAYRGRHVDFSDVRNLTKAEAGQIYRQNYWDKIHGDELPSGVDFAVFDFGVNSGPGTAAKFLQHALGVPADGAIGPVTLAAANKANPAVLINRYMDARLDYLESLRTWPTFGKGWTSRVAAVRREALKMAGATVPHRLPDDPGVEPPHPAKSSGFLDAIMALLRSLFGAS